MFNFIIQLFAFIGVVFILTLIVSLIMFKIQESKEKRNDGESKTETRTIKNDILEAWNSDPQRISDNDGKNDAEFISKEITNFYKATEEDQKSSFIKSINVESDSAATQIMVMTIKIKSDRDNCDDEINETKNRFIDVLNSYVFNIDDDRFINKNNGLVSFCDNLHVNLFGSMNTKYAQDLQNGIYSIESKLPLKDEDDYIFTIRFSTEYTDENKNNPPMGRYYFGCKVGNQLLIERLIDDLNDCLIKYKANVDISNDLIMIRQYVKSHINPWHFHKRNN